MPEYVYLAVIDEPEQYLVTIYGSFDAAAKHKFTNEPNEDIQEHEHQYVPVIDKNVWFCFAPGPHCSAAIEKHKVLS